MKKMTAMIFAAAVSVAATAGVFAQDASGQAPNWGRMPGWGGGGGGIMWRLMTDQNGNLLARDAFIERLDQAVAGGLVADTEKAWIVQMYDRHQSGNAIAPNGFDRGRFGGGPSYGPRGGRQGGRMGGRGGCGFCW